MAKLFERLNLNDLFEDKYYIIPDYQRGYSWTDKQIDDFWNDIIQAQKTKQKHYFGTFYLKYNNETEYYEMIDGQQRLTTLFVLLILLYEDADVYNAFWSNCIEKNNIWHLTYSDGNSNKNYLEGRIYSNRSGNFTENNIYKKNLKNLKENLSNKLASLENRESFFNYIKTNLIFDLRYIYNDEESIDENLLFETLNNRGLGVSILEKLKNRLICLDKKYVDAQESLRENINESWSEIYRNLGIVIDDGNDIYSLDENEFIASHLTIYRKPLWGVFYEDGAEEKLFQMFCDNPEEYEKDECYEQKSEIKNPEEKVDVFKIDNYVNDLVDFSRAWSRMHKGTDSHVKEILSLDSSREIKIFVATILMYFPFDSKPILDLLEKYLFRNSFPNYAAACGRLDMSLPTFARKLNGMLSVNDNDIKIEEGKTLYDAIIQILNKALETPIDKDYFMEQMVLLYSYKRGNIGFYRWSGLKYFLFKYDKHIKQRDNKRIPFISFSEFDKYSIEHIFPQTPNEVEWDDMLQSIRNRFDRPRADISSYVEIIKNSLGNLTLLQSGEEQSNAKNYSWIEKKRIYQDTDICQQTYNLREVCEYKNWTLDEVIDRGKKMLSFLAHMLNNSKERGRNISFARDSDYLLLNKEN